MVYLTHHPVWAFVLCFFFSFLCIGFGIATLVAFKLRRFYIKPSLERDRLAIKPPPKPAPIVVIVDERADPKDDPKAAEEGEAIADENKRKAGNKGVKKQVQEVDFVQRNKVAALQAAEKKKAAKAAAVALKTRKTGAEIEQERQEKEVKEMGEEEKQKLEEEKKRKQELEEKKKREAMMKVNIAGVSNVMDVRRKQEEAKKQAELDKLREAEMEVRKKRREADKKRYEAALLLRMNEVSRQEAEHEKAKASEERQQKEEDKLIKRELILAKEERRDPDPDIVPAGILLGLGYRPPADDSDDDDSTEPSDDEAISKSKSSITEAEKQENISRRGSAFPVLPGIQSAAVSSSEEEVTDSDGSGLEEEIAEGAASVSAAVEGKKAVKKTRKIKKANKEVASAGSEALPKPKKKLKKIKKSSKGKAKKSLVIWGDEVDVDEKKKKDDPYEKERVAKMRKIDMGMGVEMYTDPKAAKKIKTLTQQVEGKERKHMEKRSKTIAMLDEDTREQLDRIKTMPELVREGLKKPTRPLTEFEHADVERKRIAQIQSERFKKLGLGWVDNFEA